MRRGIRLVIAAIGLLLLLMAGIMTVGAMPDTQENPPNLEGTYMGSAVCSMCHAQDDTWHMTTHSQMVQPPTEDTILGDLAADDEVLTIVWPDGAERPVTAEDITYVLGGRYMQRYVSVIADNDGVPQYYILPVQWNIPQTEDQVGVWTEYHADDWLEPERDWRVACAGCHTTGLDAATAAETTNFLFVDEWKAGHVEFGVGCESCHGPGSEHLTGPTTDNIVHSPDAAICGQCHIQGEAPDGEHGYPVGYQPGLNLDETMFIPAAMDDEDAWWPTGHALTYNQYGEWLNTRHGQARPILVPECVRCHGTLPDSTDPTPEEDTPAAEAFPGPTCMACHNPHPSDEAMTDAWDAQAMLKAESYTLCVDCHNSHTLEGDPFLMGNTIHHPVQEMYEGWSVIEEVAGIPSPHFSAEDGPDCITCHMPETVQIGEYGMVSSHFMRPVLPGEATDIQPDTCSGCHGDIASREALHALITGLQTKTEERLIAINNAMDNNSPDWMKMAVAFVEGDASSGIHNPTYTDALLDALEAELNLGPEIAPTLSPDELGIEIRPSEEMADTGTELTTEADSGLETPSIVLLAIVGLILAVAAYAFFLREARA
ncbi:MAG: hypothetical protein JXA10_08300 [Anaerolineae bacterium]|nr:hypothetical protein [Anaerolineae bacterium]